MLYFNQKQGDKQTRKGENNMTKLRNVRIEEVSRKTGRIGRGQTLWTNKTEQELRDWFYSETDKVYIRFIELKEGEIYTIR